MDILSESIGLSPEKTRTASSAQRARAASASPRDSDVFERVNRPNSRSSSRARSESNYNTGNVTEHFSNARTPAPRTPALNSEQRSFL